MSEQIIEIQEAEGDLLACATYLAERIGSSDGYAEAMKELIPFYLAKGEVDTAAEFADSIDDPFVRDQLLAVVAEKCAEIDDDEYAIQLSEAIEDNSFKGVCLEGIVKQKAAKKQFEKAFEIAGTLEHGSNAYAEIAVRQEKNEALKTVEKIEFPYTRVNVILEISNHSKDLSLLEKATGIAKEIEFEEERIRAYLAISLQHIETKHKDKAIEVLDKARQFAESLDSAQKDSFLSQISQGFIKAGSLDMADRTLDLVNDKYEIASALVGYADEFWSKNENGEAIEALDEAYQILKSQRDTETRNTKAKFNLLGIIAIRFAVFGQLERGIEIANENPFEEIRNNCLTQIAITCETEGNDELAHQSINDIDDDAEKTFALMALSDVRRGKNQSDEALRQLDEAYHHTGMVQQVSMKSLILNRLARRLKIVGETERARNLCSESLRVISGILDESHRVSALASLAEALDALEFELNEDDKEVMQTMIRKATW